MKKHRPLSAVRAFTLVELLTVIAILVVLAIVSGPSLSALKGAGDVNKAASDLAGVLELARIHALTHQTFVRVAIADVPPEGRHMTGAVIVLPLASSDGTLIEDKGSSMADAAKWPALSRPLVLTALRMRDDLDAVTPDTSSDSVPSASNLPGGEVLRRDITGFGEREFSALLQFDPRGQVSVVKGVPARQVKIALDRRDAGAGRNPALIRISGNTGRVQVFRAENLAP